VSTGGGTDAAFAGLKGMVGRRGLRLAQASVLHSNDAESILVDNIEPRLYLTVRMIMDFSRGKVATQ
jgi:glutamate carboxypeptidase